MYHYDEKGKRVEGSAPDSASAKSKFSRFAGDEESVVVKENFKQPGESSPWKISIICAIVLAIIFLIMSIYCFYKSRSDSSYFTYAILWLIIGILCGAAAGLFYYWASKKPENFKFGIKK